MRVLITDITSYKAAVIGRFLAKHYPGIEVIGTDHRPFAQKVHTRWIRNVEILPEGPEAGLSYVQALAQLVTARQVDCLIPVNSKEMRQLMLARDLFGPALAYVGTLEDYARLDNKSAFGALMVDLDLPAPRNHSTLDAPLPLVVKPSRGSSSKGVFYLRTEDDRAAARRLIGEELSSHVIQDFVEGEGVGFSGFFSSGRILVGYAHRRVAEYPASGGSSVVREAYPYDDEPELRSLVQRVLATVSWSGFAMFELKRRGPGDFSFIECNPRIWGSIHQGLTDGVNYFEPLLGPPQSRLESLGTQTTLLPLNILSALGYLKRGKFGKVCDALIPSLTGRADIHPLTDPMGFLALLRRGP